MKYRIEMQTLAGRYVVALKDPETGDLLKTLVVNASAAEMLRLYRDGLEVSTISEMLSQKYGIPADRIHADVEAFLGQF